MKLLAAMIAVSVLSFWGPPRPVDFRADQIENTQVFASLAILGRVNVVVQPVVARALQTLNLSGMTPLQMMHAVAQKQGLVVTRVPGIASASYMIERPDAAVRPEVFLVPATSSRAGLTDFAFADVELQHIIETIGVLAGVNVIVDPQVARAKMYFTARQVTPIDALRLVCRAQWLGARLMDEVTAPTILVARTEKIQRRLSWTPPHTGPREQYSFKDVELADIFRTLAGRARVNVILDPQVGRAKMQVALKNVTPIEAIAALAVTQELAVLPAAFVKERTTYAIGRRDKIERNFFAPRLRPGEIMNVDHDDTFAVAKAMLSKAGGFTIEDRVTLPDTRTGPVWLGSVTPAEALALFAWTLELQIRETPTGYVLDRVGAELRDTLLDVAQRGKANVVVQHTGRDAPAVAALQGAHDADADLRHIARQSGRALMTHGAGPDAIRMVLLEMPRRTPIPLVTQAPGPRFNLRLKDQGVPSIAEEISKNHGATVIAAGYYFWPSYSMELTNVTARAVVEALAAAEQKPFKAIELPAMGRPTFLIAPADFVVPAFPTRPKAEVRQHVSFAGLAWEAAVLHLARLGGLKLSGAIPEPRGGSWRDWKSAAMDLKDTTPLEALYLLALRNGLKVVAVGSGYRLE